MSIQQHLEKLEKQRSDTQSELDEISELRREFPDLAIDRDRWGRVRYMAKSANPRVDKVLFHSNCGCCHDSPLHARPYLKLPSGITIYSHPCNVMVGSPSSWGDGFQERAGWRRTYEDAGVNPEVIAAIQEHIEHLSCSDNEEEDDDDEL